MRKNYKPKLLILLSSIVVSFIPIWNLDAQTLAEETFDYTAGESIHDKTGGFGWGDGKGGTNNVGWNVQNDDVSVPGYNVSDVVLSYTDYTFFGKNMVGGDGYQSTGRFLDNSPTGVFSSYLVDSDADLGDGNEIGAGNLWFSFFVQKTDATADVHLTLSGNDIDWNYNGNPKISFGYFGAASETAGVKYWSVRLLGGTVHQTTVPVTVGAAALFSANIKFNDPSPGSTTVDVYINPPIGLTPPASPDLSLTSTDNLAFKSLAVHMEPGHNLGHVDEIRFGADFGGSLGFNGTLPITLLYFSAKIHNEQVLLEWETLNETDNESFGIERSKDAVLWESIKIIENTGSSSNKRYYTTTDSNPPYGISYYRLKQLDIDGEFSYSGIIAIDIKDNAMAIPIQGYPNPTTGLVHLSNEKIDGDYTVQILDIRGKVLQTRSNPVQLDLSNFAAGTYYLAISFKDEDPQISRLILIKKYL